MEKKFLKQGTIFYTFRFIISLDKSIWLATFRRASVVWFLLAGTNILQLTSHYHTLKFNKLYRLCQILTNNKPIFFINYVNVINHFYEHDYRHIYRPKDRACARALSADIYVQMSFVLVPKILELLIPICFARFRRHLLQWHC